MTAASIASRTLLLVRLERAAGQAFGCEQDGSPIARVTFVNPTTVAFATVVTCVAAAVAYLI